MSRELTAGVQTALTQPTIRPVTLVKMLLDTPIHVHSAIGDIDFNGDTYLGVGNFGGITPIEESGSVAPTGIKATLTGIPAEYLSLVIGTHYQGVQADVYVGLLDADYALIVDPALAFRGRVDYADIQFGEEAKISLSIENRLVDWNRPRVRRYTHEDQQNEYPLDMGLEFIAGMVEKPIVWGY